MLLRVGFWLAEGTARWLDCAEERELGDRHCPWGLALALKETSLWGSQEGRLSGQASLPPQPHALGLGGSLMWSFLDLSQGSLFFRFWKSLVIRCEMFVPSSRA